MLAIDASIIFDFNTSSIFSSALAIKEVISKSSILLSFNIILIALNKSTSSSLFITESSL